MLRSRSTLIATAFWIWVVVVMAAYLYQFHDIADRVIEVLLRGA